MSWRPSTGKVYEGSWRISKGTDFHVVFVGEPNTTVHVCSRPLKHGMAPRRHLTVLDKSLFFSKSFFFHFGLWCFIKCILFQDTLPKDPFNPRPSQHKFNMQSIINTIYLFHLVVYVSHQSPNTLNRARPNRLIYQHMTTQHLLPHVSTFPLCFLFV